MRPNLFLVMLTLAMCFAPALLDAQQKPVAESLELQMARSERVYVGHITHVGAPVGARESRHATVTIEIDQTLKGIAAHSLSLDLSFDRYQSGLYPYFVAAPKVFESLTRNKRVVVCLRPGLSDAPGSERLFFFGLDEPDLQVLSDSPVRVLRTPEAVIEAGRAAGLVYPTRLTHLKLSRLDYDVYQEVLKGTTLAGYENYILDKNQPRE